MMSDSLTLPVDACAPDADRVGPDAPARLPEWLVHLIARVIRFLLDRTLAARSGRSPLPAWLHDRPDLPLGSAQALAASIRGAFGNAIAWNCRRRGIGPGHPEWPELSRAIVAFGGSIHGFRPGLPACGLQWWENPDIVPGMTGETPATLAATALAALLARPAVADARPPAPRVLPAEAEPIALPAIRRHVLARTATGPPTGPPSVWNDRHLASDERGQPMAGPAVLIRANPNTPACPGMAARRDAQPHRRLMLVSGHQVFARTSPNRFP
jgi:hypothetical protein